MPSGALSLLPAITGLLVFAKPTQRPYFDNVRKWSRSLLLPYFTWGLLGAASLYSLYFMGLMKNYDSSFVDISVFNVLDAAFGLETMPFNYPVYFMRNMFLLLLFYPIIDWMVRKLGFWPVLFLILMRLVGAPLPLFYDSWAIPLGLFIGAYVATRGHLLDWADRVGPVAIVLWLGAGLLQASNLAYLHSGWILGQDVYIDAVSSLSAIVGVWWLSQFFIRPGLKGFFSRLFPYSFPLFCIHALVLRITVRLFSLVFGYAEETFLVYQIVAVPFTILTCIAIAWLGERLAPRLWAFVMGQRSRSFIERSRQKLATPS